MHNLSAIDTLFLDLDGTLLGITDQDFSDGYTKYIMTYFPEMEPEMFLKALWAGTEHMMTHNSTSQYVLESFFQKFTEITGIDRRSTYERFNSFYNNEFSNLKEYCTHIPEARELVDIANEKGMKVILATNPVFPEIATRQRCEWASLDFDEFLYVSHAENSHACKPSKSYYERLLEISHSNPERTLMVGNDYLFDGSASVLGIKTWIIDRFLGNVDKKGYFTIDNEGPLSSLVEAFK